MNFVSMCVCSFSAWSELGVWWSMTYLAVAAAPTSSLAKKRKGKAKKPSDVSAYWKDCRRHI